MLVNGDTHNLEEKFGRKRKSDTKAFTLCAAVL
jgi:hypothetical protein